MRFEYAVWRLCAAVAVAAALAGLSPARAENTFQQGLNAYLNGEYPEALELWKPAAESGDEVAAFNIGVLYARGLGVETDPVEALRWYRQSALAGYADAQFNLGDAYYQGTGTQINIGQAVSWWEKAAGQDHPEASYNLGILYRDGTAVERDVERAVMLFRQAAAAGDARAESALARLKDRAPPDDGGAGGGAAASAPDQASAPGRGGDWPADENPDHWAVQLFAAAEKGAARRFVIDHGLSEKVRIYEAEADGKTWFKGVSGSHADQGAARAARAELEAHLPDASAPWIRRYRDIQAEAVAEIPVAVAAPRRVAGNPAPGSGEAAPPEDDTADADESAPAEDAGGPPASPATAGEAVPEEEAAPAETTGEAAAKPSGEQSRLRQGQRAFNAQDYETAFEVWQPLAESGVPDAQYGIGFMYESGWGVEQDYSQAFRWYQLAAQQEHVRSQFNLGMLYRDGKGVARNDALGLYWIQTAADRGDERALNYLKGLN